MTFLFTDVEDSTRLWETHRSAMDDALARHDQILRLAIVENGGYVFSTAGDAFAAAFARPEYAVSAARMGSAALQAERWPAGVEIRVRMGLHTGTASERDGDYFGPTLNRAARIMSAARGGQILLSNVTAELMGGQGLVDLGRHRLKGITDAERVWQLGAGSHPPLRVHAEQSGTLPRPPNSFIGRVRETADLVELCTKKRVVTLVGAGGSGKSRSALEAALRLAPRFEDGAWWCDLQAVADRATFGPSVLAGVGGVPVADLSPLASAVHAVSGRHMLLILDNCEHLLDASAELVEAVLNTAPRVQVLCTSREPLGVAGEQVFPMGSFDAASDLFLTRARDVDPTMTFDDGELDAIAELCQKMDGLPLAIELAAARCRALGPVELLARIDERLRLLRGRRRTERHQTLRATVRWSFDLLDETEQQVFLRLSVFAGSFDLAATMAVCAGPDVDKFDVEDAVVSLVGKSMVVAVPEQRGRFRLLETIRACAEEWLAENNGGDEYRRRHGQYYCDLLGWCGRTVWSEREPEVWHVLERDWDNVRVAVADALERKDAAAIAPLGELGLWAVFAFRPEIGQWARDAIEQCAVDGKAIQANLRGAWAVCAYSATRRPRQRGPRHRARLFRRAFRGERHPSTGRGVGRTGQGPA